MTGTVISVPVTHSSTRARSDDSWATAMASASWQISVTRVTP
jgi:hypothetical protein